MQTPMTSCHLISMWHEWNANTGDIMVTWFASYASLVTSCWACTLCACKYGACAIIKMGTLKYLDGLTGMPADSKLMKFPASHYKALINQNAKENMPNMFPLVYLNENLRYCNENLAWGKQEPLIHPYVFWYSTKGEKVVKNSFYVIFL